MLYRGIYVKNCVKRGRAAAISEIMFEALHNGVGIGAKCDALK